MKINYNLLLFVLYVIFYFSMMTYSSIGNAKVLIQTQDVSDEEFKQFLYLNSEYFSYSDYFKNESGTIDSQLIAKFDSCKIQNKIDSKSKECVQELIEIIQFKFLSEGLKNLLIETLKIKSDIESVNYFLDRNNLFKLSNNLSHPYKFKYELNSNDQLYINGWKIELDEILNLSFDPNAIYHISIISNQYAPVLYFGFINNFSPIKSNLTMGQCNNSASRFSETSFIPRNQNNLFALYNNHCVSPIMFKANQQKFTEKFENFNPIPLSTSSHFYTQKSFWIGAILTSFILYFGTKEYFNKNEIVIEMNY